VGEYAVGAPVLYLDNERFAQETRLHSRYQQLLEIAFDSAKEDHPSREYFNGLLMESLYRLFDKRGNSDGAKVSEILFESDGDATSSSRSTKKTAKPRVNSFTSRDVEKINQAIIRLLDLALAHKAISSDAPNFS